MRIKDTFKKLLKEKNEEKKKELLNLLYKYVDKAVKEGIIHENKGARIKSKAVKVLIAKWKGLINPVDLREKEGTVSEQGWRQEEEEEL